MYGRGIAEREPPLIIFLSSDLNVSGKFRLGRMAFLRHNTGIQHQCEGCWIHSCLRLYYDRNYMLVDTNQS